ncbi:pentapeptide repeat-containing protein, partial [Plesiomonas shigelloides]
MKKALVHEKILPDQFTGEHVKNITFSNCDFSGVDLTDTEFVDCNFYDRDSREGCNFNRAKLKNASFKRCDLSMCNFKNISALGLEISECLAQGADFRGASFM